MDAYTVYLNTFRYVMSADPTVKSTWCDVFKYLPCLRRMLACSVCGNLLRNPHGAANGVCLHHVCYKCLGGKLSLKPSCSWCKDHSFFKENKKLRALVLCFKKLCAFISHSRLGCAIQASSVNGHDNEVENTQKALKDAEQSDDDYELTPPPADSSGILKQDSVKEYRHSFTEFKPSTSGFVRKPNNFSPKKVNTGIQKKKRGRKKGISNFTLKSSPKSNASIHVKRLKRKALTTSRRNAASQKFQLKTVASKKRRRDKTAPVNPGQLLISQRPHRELSGKFSVGQLWRETFLEETSPEPEVYPDSGIEVGNSSDQDHGAQSPKSSQGKEDKSSSTASATEKMQYPIRDTRLHPIAESPQGNGSMTISTNEGSVKPKLTLKIPKKRFQKMSSNSCPRGLYYKNEESVSSAVSKLAAKLPANKITQMRCRGRGVNTRVKNALKQRKDICRCARFKRPNQLTCFGQKCPCYRDKKACQDCLCNGCKNPRRHSDSAPPLMHVSKSGKDNLCLSPDVDLSMPRLSPIPRM